MQKAQWILGLATMLAVVATPANAQRPYTVMVPSLTNWSVQEELRLTAEQKAKLQAVAQEQQERIAKLRDVPPESRAKNFAEIREGSRKSYDAILHEAQRKRFKQIQFQFDPLASLATDEVVKELIITDKQKEKLKRLSVDLETETKELLKSRAEINENWPKTIALRKETVEKALKLLSNEQLVKWKEFVGAPFTMKTDAEKPFELPVWAKTIFNNATTFELYSLDPEDVEKAEASTKFHGWKILGKTTFKRNDENGKRLLNALNNATFSQGAKCYFPRHAIHAEHDGSSIDIVICFQCSWVRVYSGDNSAILSIDRSPKDTFNKILTDAKVPFPKKRDP